MNNKIKDNTKSVIYALITIFSFIAVSVGATYAFYYATVRGNDDNGNVRIQSARVVAVFNSEKDLHDMHVLPGYSNDMVFSIQNLTESIDAYAYYDLLMTVEESFSDPSFTFSLVGETYRGEEKISNDIEHNEVINLNERMVPEISTVLGTGLINSGITHRYTLTIRFKETGENQEYLEGKSFSAVISARGRE